MSSRQTNEAVEAYRKVAKTERRLGREEIELARRVEGLSTDDFVDYVNKTTAIDEALAVIPEGAPEIVAVTAMNAAGRDEMGA